MRSLMSCPAVVSTAVHARNESGDEAAVNAAPPGLTSGPCGRPRTRLGSALKVDRAEAARRRGRVRPGSRALDDIDPEVLRLQRARCAIHRGRE